MLQEATINDIETIIELIKKRINWMDEENIEQWNKDNYLNYYNNEYFTQKVKNKELYIIKKIIE